VRDIKDRVLQARVLCCVVVLFVCAVGYKVRLLTVLSAVCLCRPNLCVCVLRMPVPMAVRPKA